MKAHCEWCECRATVRLKAAKNYVRFGCDAHRRKIEMQAHLDGYDSYDMTPIQNWGAHNVGATQSYVP